MHRCTRVGLKLCRGVSQGGDCDPCAPTADWVTGDGRVTPSAEIADELGSNPEGFTGREAVRDADDIAGTASDPP